MSALLRIRKAMQTTINHIVLRSREKEIVQSTIERLHWNALLHTAHLDRRSWRLDSSKMIIMWIELWATTASMHQRQLSFIDQFAEAQQLNCFELFACSLLCSCQQHRTNKFILCDLHSFNGLFFCSTTWAVCVCVCARVCMVCLHWSVVAR